MEATILTKGGGIFPPIFNSFFCRTFGQIVFIHRWQFSLNHDGWDKKNPHIQGKGMVGLPNLATFHSTTKAMMSKVLLRGRPLNPEGEWTDRICRDKNIYFQHGTGQRLFPYTHKNKTHRVARLTHDTKVADSVPPVPPRPTNHARLHLRCVRIDPRMTPKPPFTGYVYTAVQKSASYIEHPPSVITYHTHLCCFVFATTFFFKFCFSLFWKKIVPPFCRLATPLSLYTFLLWIISKHTYLPEGYRMMVYFWILL